MIIRGTGTDGDMSLEAEGNLIAGGGQQQYQVVSNNPAATPNVNHISIRQGAWYHPKYNRSRAVECLQMATNTGDCSLLMTLLRPGIDDKNDNRYGMVNGSESEEGGTIVLKNKRKKKNQYPTVPEVSSNFSHQQQQPQPQQQQLFQHQMQNVINAGINNNQLLNQMQNIINAGQQIQKVMNDGINNNMGIYSGQLRSPPSQQMMGLQMQEREYLQSFCTILHPVWGLNGMRVLVKYVV
jgi:hypothetical protein